MELPKNSSVVGCKDLQEGENILRFEKVNVRKLVKLQSVVRCKVKNQTWKLVGLSRVVICKWWSVCGSRFKGGFRLDWFFLEE